MQDEKNAVSFLIHVPGRSRSKVICCEFWIFFSKAGYDIHVHVTQCQLDARKTVEHLGKNVDVIVCSGGDGTLNENYIRNVTAEKDPFL